MTPSTVEKALRRFGQVKDRQGIAGLLAACAGELGRVHRLGLCHGRPHPRDMFIAADRIGFLDFEESPAEVMPLAVAQARDMMLFILTTSDVTATLEAGIKPLLAAWKAEAPQEARQEFERQASRLRFLRLPVNVLRRLIRGKDMQRLAAMIVFLT